MAPAVVLDACVLYPAPLRSLFMYLALTGQFRAKWSDDIHEEWMRNVAQDYPDISRSQVERIRDLMNAHVPDCVVTGHQALTPTLTLPDPDDRHVLAVAVHAQADTIITFNLRDFPASVLAPLGVTALHPDDFVTRLLGSAPAAVCDAVKRQRASLKNPPLSVDEFLASLERQGLPQTAAALRAFSAVI